MAEIINLNKARKLRQRTEKQRRASVNRARSGRSKVERLRDAAERKKQDNELDKKKID